VKINGENASDNALRMVNVGRLAIFFQYMTKTIFKNKKNGGMIKSKDLDCCGSNMHI
jgi:hypothetical protein